LPVRIDPATMEVKSASAAGGSSPADVAAGADGVWVTDNGPKGHFVFRFDTTGKLVAKIKTPAMTLEVTTSDGAAWVLIDDQSSGTASLLRIDPQTNRIVQSIPVAGDSLHGSALTRGIAATQNAVWIARQTGDGDEVVRIDTRSNRIVAAVLVPDELRDLGSGEGRVWISLAKRPGIAWIDPATNGLAGTVTLARDAQQMTAGDGFVWVTPNEGLDYVWRVTI
jgi:virginiamycin B lyase